MLISRAKYFQGEIIQILLTLFFLFSASSALARGSLETEIGFFDYTPTFQILQTSNLTVEGEKHLKNVKQLSFAGKNAEAYFSFDGKKLVFASNRNAAKLGDTNVFIADWVE